VDLCGFHEHLLCAKERNMLVGRGARLFGTSALCQEESELLSSVSIAGQFLLINTLVMVLFSYIMCQHFC
jgi:hypothetical protein